MALVLADPAGIFAEELHTKSNICDQQGSCWNREPAVETGRQSRKRGQIAIHRQKNVGIWGYRVLSLNPKFVLGNFL